MNFVHRLSPNISRRGKSAHAPWWDLCLVISSSLNIFISFRPISTLLLIVNSFYEHRQPLDSSIPLQLVFSYFFYFLASSALSTARLFSPFRLSLSLLIILLLSASIHSQPNLTLTTPPNALDCFAQFFFLARR